MMLVRKALMLAPLTPVPHKAEKTQVGRLAGKVLMPPLAKAAGRRALVPRFRSRMLAALVPSLAKAAGRRVRFLRMARRIVAKRAGGRIRACPFARCALLSVASRVS